MGQIVRSGELRKLGQYLLHTLPKLFLPLGYILQVSVINPPALVKKIGRTTYIVRIHFSETSRETMSDKIKRMLKNEIRQMG